MKAERRKQEELSQTDYSKNAVQIVFFDAGGFNDEWKTKSLELLVKNSPYKIGEEIAVAQSYSEIQEYLPQDPTGLDTSDGIDKFSYHDYSNDAGWSNKMFTKPDLLPHRIKITNIRVERLQDISDEDCLKEGLEFANGGYYTSYNKETNSRIWLGNTPREAFAHLINKTCGKGTWESNPWVFVYEFELVK